MDPEIKWAIELNSNYLTGQSYSKIKLKTKMLQEQSDSKVSSRKINN
jgi:hypothetical protein